MADNVPITSGSGTSIATDDVGGVHYQRVKPAFGPDGAAVDVSAATPLPATVDTGTLVQRMEALLIVMRQLLAGAGGQPHDGLGRTRVAVDTFGTSATLPTVATVTTVTTVTTVATVTKLSQLGAGAYPAELMLFAQSNSAALALRDRITVT